MKTCTPAIAIFLLVAACNSEDPMAAPSRDAEQVSDSELVVRWNELLLSTAEAEDGFLTLKGVRAAAMLHLAVHDALNTIERRFEPYVATDPSDGGDPLAAAAQAAYAVAVSQYPGEVERFEAERDRWLSRVSDATARQTGVELGERAAQRILASRSEDGWDNQAEYQWHPMGPGVYAEFAEHSGTPEGFIFGSGWATARPFFLSAPDQFRSPPPPAIESDEYTRAFGEVKGVGSFASTLRTPDQSHLAMWWKDFAESSQNRLTRQLVAEDELDLWRAARVFALLNSGIFDAYVNVFENKFFYNHWRPYTAIRWADHDGNPATEPDPEWNNLHRHTYAFPSYPSAHGTACGAAFTVLADTFGEGRPFSMTTHRVDQAGPGSPKIEMDPPTRSFESFSDAAMECSMSRVYLGIHFRYDSIEGNALGNRIGELAVATRLRPLSEM
jgi:membrane-associated phospholipid phosphatase